MANGDQKDTDGTAAGQPAHVHHGRTIGDALSMLFDWRHALAAWLFLSGVGLSAVVLYGITFMWLPGLLGITQTNLKIGSMESLVLFQAKQGKALISVSIVHPQGWQDTDIEVKEHQLMTFKAGGQIQVDVNGLVEQARQRAVWEQLLRQPPTSLNPDSEADTNIPEDHFTPQQVAQMKDERLYRPWTGPNGYPPQVRAWRARNARLIGRDAPLGALLGQVRGPDGSRSDIFIIGAGGAGHAIPAAKDGTLWVTVNDVGSDNTVPLLFFRDNVGFFWLKAEVADAPKR
jgi:hypothetical protein